MINLDFYETVTGFNCPYHGIETNLFCFRGWEPKNRSRWHKYKVTYQQLPITEEEIDTVIDTVLNQQPIK